MKTINSSTFSGHPRGGPQEGPLEDHFPHEIQVEGLLVRKKPGIQTWKATLPHQIEVEGFRLEPYTTTFPHQIEVEGLFVCKKPYIIQG